MLKAIAQYLCASAALLSLVAFVYFGVAAHQYLDPRRHKSKFGAFFSKLGPEDFVGYGFTMYTRQAMSAAAALLFMGVWAATLDR